MLYSRVVDRRHAALLVLAPLLGCATPLSKAAKRGDSAAVERLLAQGADPDKSGGFGEYPLYYAAWAGNARIARQLLDKGARADRHPLLALAARGGSTEVVELLLSHGANLNDSGGGGPYALAPLASVAMSGDARMARFLIEHGADPEQALVEVGYYESSNVHKGWREQGRQGRMLLERLTKPAAAPSAPAAVPPAATEPAAPPPAPSAPSAVDVPGYRSAARPRAFAIVVGIDRYKSLPSARFAERDAEAVRDHLLAMGYPGRHVVLLRGADATRTGITKYLEEWLPRNVSPDSEVFFYYSGHGAPDEKSGDAYLVPWDGDPQFLQSTAYPAKRLYASLANLKAKRTIVALDACFSGAGGRSVLAEGARPLVVRVEDQAPKGDLVLFTAAASDQITTTLPGEGHGIFTYFFLKGLQGEAADRSGRVTVRGLYRYLKPLVEDEARLQNREQTPTLRAADDSVLRGD